MRGSATAGHLPPVPKHPRNTTYFRPIVSAVAPAIFREPFVPAHRDAPLGPPRLRVLQPKPASVQQRLVPQPSEKDQGIGVPDSENILEHPFRSSLELACKIVQETSQPLCQLFTAGPALALLNHVNRRVLFVVPGHKAELNRPNGATKKNVASGRARANP
jgi:hypothetical protein